MSRVGTALMVRIYEASARSSLDRGEFGEFLAIASKLVWELGYRQCCTSQWLYSSVLLLYGSMEATSPDFCKLFYHQTETDSSVLAVLDGVWSIRSGNVYQLDRLFHGILSSVPTRLRAHLRQRAVEVLERAYGEALRPCPRTLLDRIVNKAPC